MVAYAQEYFLCLPAVLILPTYEVDYFLGLYALTVISQSLSSKYVLVTSAGEDFFPISESALV